QAGTFSVASEDVLKSRAMKKAKRRGAAAETESGATFKGFKGFSLTPSAGSSSTAAFSGLGAPAALSNGAGERRLPVGRRRAGRKRQPHLRPSVCARARLRDVPLVSSGLTLGAARPKQTNGAASPSPAPCSSAEYNKQLTALNCSVRDWIAKHVDDNPLCDLNPIFRDYERHLATIERRYELRQTEAPGTRCKGAPEAKPPPDVTFNFGQKVDGSVLAPVGPQPAPPGFFTSSSHSSVFGGAVAPGRSEEVRPPQVRHLRDEKEEEEEEPPKPEVKEVQEKDAFYSKKCKLFYRKEAEFKEKGVGTLHLKTQAAKTQLIIRADTNLGNILLNILVHASMPCTRVGRNNVMLVCVPNPPVDDKNPAPSPLLLRVKTAEDADELHKILEEKRS
uniref:Nuclear pore complex protein Nup50 n=1 Tax=Tetraodon nigroviridis TaxID=99883 RepID=H3C7V0_TETNG